MNGPASFISPCNAGPSTFFQLMIRDHYFGTVI